MSRIEGRKRFVPEQPQGGILAHAMGLGKTTSMLGLIDQSRSRLTLVVCPKSVLQQWREEALRVTQIEADSIVVYHGAHRANMLDQCATARIVLTTFDIVRLDHVMHEDKENSERVTLFSTVWDRVVVDEAHHICEQGSKTAKAIRALRSPNRWCITGTPFKNGVADLVALAKFLCVVPYSDPSWWRVYSKNVGKLREWRENFVSMHGKDALDLPPVHAVVSRCHEGKGERSLLETMETMNALRVPSTPDELNDSGWYENIETSSLSQQHELLKILRLRQLANHPLMLVPTDTARFLCSGKAVPEGGCEGCGAATGRRTSLCSTHVVCSDCQSQNIMCPACLVEPLEREGTWRHSSKTRVLWDYVRQYPDAKMVVFSQWTTCLDLLGLMFKTMGIECIRFDGRINSLEERTEIIQHFRDTDSCKILLTSLGAGGEGLNLTCATHVVLVEPYWNSAVEQQAVDRVHRIGQQHPVHVLRLIMEGSRTERVEGEKPSASCAGLTASNSIEQWVLDIQQYKNQELDRLLLGREPVGDGSKYVSRNGNSVLRLSDALMTVKMRFNEPASAATYNQVGHSGNLVRFFRHPPQKKRKIDLK